MDCLKPPRFSCHASTRWITGSMAFARTRLNADRIRSGLLTEDMVRTRSKARGLSEGRAYMSGNLLGREVLSEDVAKAFVDLACSKKTTAAVLTVDGGNIEAAVAVIR